MGAENKRDHRISFLINIAYWVVILAIVFLVFKYLINLVMPFFLAFIFAAVVRPISRMLSRKERYKRMPSGEKVLVKRRFPMNQAAAGVISALVLFVVLAGLLALALVQAVDGVSAFVASVPTLYEQKILPTITTVLLEIEEFAARIDESVLEMVQTAIPNILSSIGSAVTNFSAKAVALIANFVTRVPSLLLNTIICLIATVFIAVDFNRLSAFIRRNLPEKPLAMARNVRDSFLSTIWQFIRSYFFIFCITATEITVGLLLIGVEKPLLIGILIAVFDAFPIVGSGMILLPWAIITMITGQLWRGLALAALYATVVIARQVIEPKIVGKHVGLRPIVTLVCMFVGSKLFGGLIGLFGLPITAAILVDLNDSGIIHLFKRPEATEKAEEKA